MKRCVLLIGALAAVLSLSAAQEALKGSAAIAKFPARLQNSEIAHLADASWCQLMPGVEYFYGRFDLLYNTTANEVSFYKIDYQNAPLRMKFVDNRRNGGSNKRTSYVAGQYDALFGINCTFPAWFSKMEGKVINNGTKEGGLALNDDKTFEFFNSSWWTDHPNADGYSDAFSTEAMGLYHGSQGLSGTTWGQAPYTFMGATQDGVLYVCVVDGRTNRSQGLGYGTVHSFLIELGCYDGMCIDGGGSTAMVCRKDLMPAGVNPLQHDSEESANHYTMNFTIDTSAGAEREVCNQLMFIEDVGTITSTLGRHGSCSLGTGTVKVDKNSTQSFTITADSGYLIAALAVNGETIAAAKGKTSYTGTVVADGDKTIAASFARKDAWWMRPTVQNDFLLEEKSGNGTSDLTTQHPDVVLDEQEQDVFFATSVHGYSSSYLTGVQEFSAAALKEAPTGVTVVPVMGTRKNVGTTGTYAYSIAASRAAGALLAAQKVGSGTIYPVICPIGGEWGGGADFNSTRDDRYVSAVLSFPDDAKDYHTTSPCAFGTDGRRFFGGYSRNAHIHEFDVMTGADGHLEFHHTGKVIKHKANVTALVCKRVTLGGQAKDVLFTAHHSSTLDALAIVVPGELAVATNSSSLPTTLTIPYKLDNIAVTGIADGTPRIIGHVMDTANEQHGNYVVYDLLEDLSGFLFSDPIAIVNAQAAFGKVTGCVASLDDDSAAFINYYNAKALHALTVRGQVLEVELPEIVGDAEATVTGDADRGFVLRPGSGNKEVTVRIPDGLETSKVRVELSPSVEQVKSAGATIAVMVGTDEITSYLSIPAATSDGVIDLSQAVVKPEIIREALDVDKDAQINLLDPDNPSLTTAKTRPGLTYVLCEGRVVNNLVAGDSTIGNGAAWTPKVSVKGGTSGFYAIDVKK